MTLLDAQGRLIEPGTRGYWLSENDFVFVGVDHEKDKARTMGPHGFPRDWPDVYTESAVLKSLIKKKGPCAAKRVSVVPPPDETYNDLLNKLNPCKLQSFRNAEEVREKVGLDVVQGWAIYDLLDDVTGAAFVAERYWWNTLADGTWIDVTPRAERVTELLLVEALAGAPKVRSELTHQQMALSEHLLSLRFPKMLNSVNLTSSLLPEKSVDLVVPAVLGVSETLEVIVKRAKLGLADAVTQALRCVEEDFEKCVEFIDADMCSLILPHLASPKNKAATIQLMSILTRVALHRGLHEKASGSILKANGIDALLQLLSLSDLGIVADAAATLADVCFRAPQAQAKAAGGATVQRLVNLIGEFADARCAGEAARLLWQLQIGREDTSEVAFKLGAAPPLIAMLSAGRTEDAKLNAAGALMQLATAPHGQDALSGSGVIPVLCELLSPECSLPLREQAAGALVNLTYRHRGNCAKVRTQENALSALVALLKEESAPAHEYAAGAISNILVGDSAFYGSGFVDAQIAKDILALGAFEALLQVLICSVNGPVSSARCEARNAIGNLASHISETEVLSCTEEVAEEMVAPLFRQTLQGQLEALSCCMNMAQHVSMKAMLTQAGIVKPLVRLLENDEKHIRERAAGTLANLMNGHPETVRAVFSQSGSDVVKKLVGILGTDDSSTTRQYASLAFAMLVTLELPRKAAHKTNAAKLLCLALEKDRQWQTALAILNMSPVVAKERRVWQRKLIANDVLASLVQMLRQREDSFAIGAGANCRFAANRLYSLATLLSLTQGSSFASKQALKAGVLDPLLEVLSNKDKESCEMKQYAVGVLGNLLKHGGLPSKQVANDEIIECILELLGSGRADGRDVVMFTIIALVEANSDGFQNSVERLISMLKDLKDLGAIGGTLLDQVGYLLKMLKHRTLT